MFRSQAAKHLADFLSSSVPQGNLEVVGYTQVDTVQVERFGIESVDRSGDWWADNPERIDIGIDLASCQGDFRQNHDRLAHADLETTKLVSELCIHLRDERKRVARDRTDVARLSKQTAILAIWLRRQRRNLFVVTADATCR